MQKKTLLISLLTQAHQEEQAFQSALTDEQRDQAGSPQQWSAKDTLGHIAAWKEHVAENLIAVREGRRATRIEDNDQHNAVLFEKLRDISWQDVQVSADKATQKLLQQVNDLSEAQIESTDFLPWQETPLWRVISGDGYSHPMIHISDFYRSRGEIARSGELLGRMTRSMADLDDSPVWQGVVKYNIACQYSLLGDKEGAIRELNEALGLHPGLVEWSQQDPDLEPIRSEPGYKALYEQ